MKNWGLGQPLLPVAMIYIGGILGADFFPMPLNGLLVAALGLALLCLVSARARTFLLVPLVFLAGATNLAFHTTILSPHDLRAVIGDRDRFVTVRGSLQETPYHRSYVQGGRESCRTLAPVAVNAVRFQETSWQPAAGRVIASTPGVLPTGYFAGQTVEITGVLSPPKPPVAEGLFDYGEYLRRAGIYFQLQTAATSAWRIPGTVPASTSPPLADRFLAWAKNILGRGLPVEDEPLRLLWAMTLGWKTALTGEVSAPFMRSGTMHIFAISGLHIALISGILVALLRVLQLPRSLCGVVVVPLLWFYTGVTGWQASAIRSTVMMTIVIAGWSLKRPSNLLNSLAAAAFLILLWQPQQLFQAGFQLSFFVVLSIALFTPVLEKLRQHWLQGDPLLPEELRPWWQRRLRAAVFWLTAGFTTSLAAWLGSVPLIACYFHLFTPVSLLANVVVVPLSGLALMSNLASLCVGGWFPAGAELFNHSAWFWMALMIRVSEWAAAVPGGWLYVAAPSPVAFIAYYSLLIAVMSGGFKKPRLRVWLAIGLAALAALNLIEWRRARSATRLTVLPLSGGSAIYFDAPGGGDDLLIDCGREAPAEKVVMPFLHARGVNRLPRLLLTHGDVQYMGGAEFVTTNFAVKQIITSSAPFRSPAYRRLMKTLERAPERRRRVNRGDAVGPWKVLHPTPADCFSQGDDNALVLAGTFNGMRVLLLSDLGRPGQNILLERNPDLKADIVITGLPTEGELLCEPLLDAIQPGVVVVADSEFPATRRAGAALRERLERRKIRVVCTRETGAVTVVFRKGDWELRAADGQNISGSGVRARKGAKNAKGTRKG
jgi:competence protein ComEC